MDLKQEEPYQHIHWDPFHPNCTCRSGKWQCAMPLQGSPTIRVFSLPSTYVRSRAFYLLCIVVFGPHSTGHRVFLPPQIASCCTHIPVCLSCNCEIYVIENSMFSNYVLAK